VLLRLLLLLLLLPGGLLASLSVILVLLESGVLQDAEPHSLGGREGLRLHDTDVIACTRH